MGRVAGGLGAVALIAGFACGCSSDAPVVRVPATAAPLPAGGQQMTIWLTGYSWWDNTPPGSSEVGEPVIHQQAGGVGTFADPITVASPGLQGAMTLKPGAKFYLPTVQRYVIVEDSGAAPPPVGAQTHLDMWVDGRDATKDTTDDCASQFTGMVPARMNPPNGLPVMAGPIFVNQKCAIPPQPDDLGTYQQAPGAPKPPS